MISPAKISSPGSKGVAASLSLSGEAEGAFFLTPIPTDIVPGPALGGYW
jgi:hypothetical protein